MDKKSNNGIIIGIAALVILIAYSVVLFVATGFTGHDGTYWVSFGAIVVACCLAGTVGFILGKTGKLLSDWFFNYPIIRHSVVYIIVEFIAATAFIILSVLLTEVNLLAVALAVQLIIIIVYLIFLVSSFQAKRISEEVRADIAQSVSAMKTLRALANSNVAYAEAENVKKACSEFADKLKFSDPVTCEQSKEYEEQLLEGIREVKALITNHNDDAVIARLKELSNLLRERNEIVESNK